MAVLGYRALRIADVEGIDRGDHAGKVEDVDRRTAGSLVRRIAVLDVRVGHVGAEAEPFFSLIVGFQTGGVARESRIGHDARVVQIAQRRIVVDLVGVARNRNVVFLAQVACVEKLVEPVVGQEQMLAVDITQGGVGVEPSVGADQRFAGRIVEDTVAHAARLVGVDVLRDVLGGLLGCELLVDPCEVAHRPGRKLHVLPGIGNDVVLRHGARVRTPFGVHRDDRLGALAALGGDQNHAVGAAGAVDGRGCSVLEHGHRLDVGGIDRRYLTVVGNAVDDVERFVAGCQRPDAADADGRLLARLSVGARRLDACRHA